MLFIITLFSSTIESSFSLAKALKRKTVYIWIHLVQEFWFCFLKNMKWKISGEREEVFVTYSWSSMLLIVFKSNIQSNTCSGEIAIPIWKMKTWTLGEIKQLAKITQRVDQGLKPKMFWPLYLASCNYMLFSLLIRMKIITFLKNQINRLSQSFTIPSN